MDSVGITSIRVHSNVAICYFDYIFSNLLQHKIWQIFYRVDLSYCILLIWLAKIEQGYFTKMSPKFGIK